MKSRIKPLLIFLIFMLLFSNFSIICSYAKSDNENNYISLDSDNKDELPVNFRSSLDLSKIEKNDLNLSGLNTLNISGSSQFTELSLKKTIENINTKFPLYIIDLRQESHGFINGSAVSLFAPGNKINSGLPLNAVIKREDLFIKSIPLNRSINLDIDKYKIVPKTVYNEETLVKTNNLYYFRIPVTDNERPTDDMVDRFIDFTKSLPEDKWLHFHCKEGIGRTTTFMILYDIMNNYKDVSIDDIIARQSSLDSLNLSNFDKNDLRYLLLQNFFKYAKDTDFNTSWVEWVKSNNIEPFTLVNEKK